jgi:general secretion pathway protein L
VDFNTLAALARQAFGWWLDELAALAPPSWRHALTSGPRVWAELDAGGVWRFERDGRPLAEGPAQDVRIGLLLPARAVLTREVPAPRMPAADLRRMLVLDMDRLSPLSPSLIHFDIEILDRAAEDGPRVLLGIAPRDDAEALWRMAVERGLSPVRLAARIDGATDERRFDFLPAVLEAAGQSSGRRAERYAWGAVAALLALNLAVLVGRDMASVQRLSDLVEAQRPAVNAVQALRRRVEAESARRRDFVARAQRAEPLRLLNTLTEALPADTWVERLEWNGQTLHLVGGKGADADLAAAIRGSGAFANPRALTSGPAINVGAGRPYDITADARPAERP